MRLMSFGGVTLPDGIPEDNLSRAARSGLQSLAAGGAHDALGGDVVIEADRITRRMIVTDSIDSTIDSLFNKLAAGRRILKAVLRDGSTYRHTFAKMMSIDYPRNIDNTMAQEISVAWEREYPYWLATVDEPRYLDNSEVLDDGWNLDGNFESESVTTTDHDFTITVSEGLSFNRGRITLRPASGASITNPKITNETNEYWLQWTGTLGDGDELIIDVGGHSVMLNGMDDYDSLSFNNMKSEWMLLEQGANSINVASGGITGTVVVEWQWSRHYL